MTIEIALLISGVSVAFGIYQGVTNLRRNNKHDDKSDATQLTTVIVKLENISNGIQEIKSELNNVKADTKQNNDKLIRLEESCKQAHKRLDGLEKLVRGYDSDE